ncbi:hypothetical protein QUF76_03055 [Desulfobacterales bacterium HSG16]|nr:hypothetical protein [Desulfobacterales bacterium HSG16]
MKKKITSMIVIGTMLALAPWAMAQHEGHDHGKKQEQAIKMEKEMDHSGHKDEMDHSDHKGEMIHESVVDGYKFAYHLIDMGAHAKKMPQMKDTHHLMVYVMSPKGHMMPKAKVGYLIQGPSDSKQKAMCMGMSGGFGADVNFGTKGTYMVKTKVMSDEKNLIDSFSYEVK